MLTFFFDIIKTKNLWIQNTNSACKWIGEYVPGRNMKLNIYKESMVLIMYAHIEVYSG